MKNSSDKKDILYDIIGEFDDELIEKAVDYKKSSKIYSFPIYKFVSVAAAFLICIVSAVMFIRMEPVNELVTDSTALPEHIIATKEPNWNSKTTETPLVVRSPEATISPEDDITTLPTKKPAVERTPAPTKETVIERTPIPTKSPVIVRTPAPTNGTVIVRTPKPTEGTVIVKTPAPTKRPVVVTTPPSTSMPELRTPKPTRQPVQTKDPYLGITESPNPAPSDVVSTELPWEPVPPVCEPTPTPTPTPTPAPTLQAN